MNGSGKVNLEHLTADTFRAVIRGAGGVRVRGDVETQSVMLEGSGRYEADDLVSDFAQLCLVGSGAIGVSVTDELNVSINGSGQVTYGGFPDISKSINGAGRLTRRRREKTAEKSGEDYG